MSHEKKDLQKIKELVDLMISNGLVELEIVDGESKIHLKRPGHDAPVVTQLPAHAVLTHPQAADRESQPLAEEAGDDFIEIKSPIVGTFYSAPSPDSDPFIKVGDRVAPDTVVCIIEAMKVMNEIKAEVAGTITELLCEPGQAIEFDQPLFKLEPN